MRRPPYFNQEWRLDQILKRKAEAGVKIYVIVYREVEVGILAGMWPGLRC
jgi:phospholipase D1/2